MQNDKDAAAREAFARCMTRFFQGDTDPDPVVVPPLGNSDPVPSEASRSPEDIVAQKFARAFRDAEQVGGGGWVPLIFDD